MTTAEASQSLGISTRRVQALIANGRLVATKQGRDWHITSEALGTFQRRPPGRPRKEKA